MCEFWHFNTIWRWSLTPNGLILPLLVAVLETIINLKIQKLACVFLCTIMKIQFGCIFRIINLKRWNYKSTNLDLIWQGRTNKIGPYNYWVIKDIKDINMFSNAIKNVLNWLSWSLSVVINSNYKLKPSNMSCIQQFKPYMNTKEAQAKTY